MSTVPPGSCYCTIQLSSSSSHSTGSQQAVPQQAQRYKVAMCPRQRLRSTALEHMQSRLKNFVTMVWYLCAKSHSNIFYCLVSLFYFAISPFWSHEVKNKQKSRMACHREVDDERVFCTKCLSAFVTLRGRCGDVYKDSKSRRHKSAGDASALASKDGARQ